jgi:hypothetical protein
MAGPFKMKGSPIQRNFGIGSPTKHGLTKPQEGRPGYSEEIPHEHPDNEKAGDRIQVGDNSYMISEKNPTKKPSN